MQKERQEVKLKDFYQSVLLKTVGFPLLRLERASSDFVTFIFSDPKGKIPETLDRYWKGGILVNAKELIDNINELKTRLHTRIK